MRVFSVSVLVAALVCRSCSAKLPRRINAQVYYSPFTLVLDDKDTHSTTIPAASATFADDIAVDGWGKLHITTNAAFSDHDQLYAAGYAEGVLTWPGIEAWSHNTKAVLFGDAEARKPLPEPLAVWLETQNEWAKKQVSAQGAGDPYWDLVGT